ncbi:protein FANTASTIC FOUR 1-like [Vicia villosa]|uniref:protein FANTASTIC FOUR 1-like n=1 Tax=Vicia villosa TaxID=3911 RepID=UPI00273B6E5A|nr:protein FANTASTIC FOUR 1-like [Vicia villosa]
MTETDSDTNTNTTLFLYNYPIPILLNSVINLFKKNIQSLLNLTTVTTAQSHSVSVSRPGLALVTTIITDKIPVPNVLESTTMLNLKLNNNENSRHPSRIGFVSGDVDGLMSCTESLGFESCDERRVCERMNMNMRMNSDEKDESWRRKITMKRGESRGNSMRTFPPPIPSLNRNGKPSFYLRPVRKDGRLELTEVRIHRPDILHASRHDGRLTLHLIPDRDSDEEEESEEEEEEDDEEVEEVEEEEIEEEEEEEVEDMGIPMVVGNSNEGVRRCHEMVNQQHLLVHGNQIRMCV